MNNTTLSKVLYAIGGIAILAGFALTISSWLGTCTQACEEGHSYRLFGLHFETVGLLYFSILTILYASSLFIPRTALYANILLASGLGAEISFLLVQKYGMQQWCPICLGIAASILIAVIAGSIDYVMTTQRILKEGKRQEISQNLVHAVLCMAAISFGFALSFAGTSKVDNLLLAETTLQQQLAFGNPDSGIDVYVFTSWSCPACKKLEPNLHRLIKPLFKDDKVIFIDHISDNTTLNYCPFNLSFMLHEKKKYFDLRTKLRELADETETPTDNQIQDAVNSIDVEYKQLNYAEVDLCIDYFKMMSTKYNISRLPTVVIVNASSQKFKMLSGTSELNKAALQKTIEEVKQDTAEADPFQPANNVKQA